MSRFVIVSFAVMGWGFYELSGGRDFVAPERPIEIANLAMTTTPPAPTAADSKFRRSAKIRADSLVTTPVLQENTAVQSVENTRPAANPEQRRATALAQIASVANALTSTSTAFAPTAETGLLHMDSLQGGLASMTNQPVGGGLSLNTSLTDTDRSTAPSNSESYLDIREIRASRVNMRQGPGTIYPVMARLLAGDEVLIIEDSGTGWLQLRTRNGSKVGWVAASLVSKKRS